MIYYGDTKSVDIYMWAKLFQELNEHYSLGASVENEENSVLLEICNFFLYFLIHTLKNSALFRWLS